MTSKSCRPPLFPAGGRSHCRQAFARPYVPSDQFVRCNPHGAISPCRPHAATARGRCHPVVAMQIAFKISLPTAVRIEWRAGFHEESQTRGIHAVVSIMGKSKGVEPMSHLLQKTQPFRSHWWHFGCLLTLLVPLSGFTAADEVVFDSGPLTFDAGIPATTGCDCEADRQPAWHGNVAGPCCNRPCCPPPNMFHADAWGQLGAKEEAKKHCLELPPSFPRFNGWRKGYMPSPKPIALPRCRHCGMPVQPGM